MTGAPCGTAIMILSRCVSNYNAHIPMCGLNLFLYKPIIVQTGLKPARATRDDNKVHLKRRDFKWNRLAALSLCFDAFPDGQPVSTWPGNAL